MRGHRPRCDHATDGNLRPASAIGGPKPTPFERREQQPHDHPGARDRRPVGARVHHDNERVVAEGTANARERANRQAFDEPATCRTERGARCREEQRAVQDPRRHGVPDTDSVQMKSPRVAAAATTAIPAIAFMLTGRYPPAFYPKNDGRTSLRLVVSIQRTDAVPGQRATDRE